MGIKSYFLKVIALLLGTISVNAQAQILPLNCYGVWDRSNAFDISVDTAYSYLRGMSADVYWKDVQNLDSNHYDWSSIQAILQTAYNNNQKVNISVGVGPDAPAWIYTNGVPGVVTNDTLHPGWAQYPYYLDADYKRYYFKLIDSFGVFLRTQPASLLGNIGYVQVKTGCTGDEVPYKGDPIDTSYNISNSMWRTFRLAAFDKYRSTFNSGSTATTMGLLFNSIDPVDQPIEWNWVLTNVTYGFGMKGGAYARGHHLSDELDFKNTFTPYLINPTGIKLFSAAEMDQTWTRPLYQINIPLGFYWGAISGLNTGLSVWLVTQSALNEAQVKPELHSVFRLFNKYAGQIYPATANAAYVFFHEGLNSQNTIKFPVSIYGSAGQSNQSRYTAICSAYASRGAQMDDVFAATKGQVYQRDHQTGYNDAGWNIEEGNYERWITQLNPDSTSIGLFRVRGVIDTNSSIYDRFARSFENSSGKNTMYFKFHHDFFSLAGPDSLVFKITWLDKHLNSTWALKYYDSSGLQTALSMTGVGDNQWKTTTVTLHHPVINQSGILGSDFLLVNTDGIDDIFHGIEVDITRIGFGPASVITGSSFHLCSAATAAFSDASPGGTWSINGADAGVASVSASGVVSGISAGTARLSYTIGTSYASAVVTVYPSPAAITGTGVICPGGATTLSDITTGGVWSSGLPLVATIGTAGVVTAAGTGAAPVYYTLPASGCSATFIVTVSSLPTAGTISGIATICTGNIAALTDPAGGGTWSSTNTAIGTVGTSGVVTALAAGTTIISYTVANSCATAAATAVVTVNAAASAGTITGAASVAAGSNITLTDAAPGGTWTASNGHATVAGGTVHGVTAGTVTISYAVTSSCGTATATKLVTVDTSTTTTTVAAITGYYFYVCAGSTVPFFDATAGGTWSVDPVDAGVASISATGIVTGLSAGTAHISYTVGAQAATAIVSVFPLPAAIGGTGSLCLGFTTTLSDATAGGTWSSGIPSVAVVSATGVVSGTIVGTLPIYYTLVAPAGCRATIIITVNVNPTNIAGPTSVCTGSSIQLTDFTAGGVWSSMSSNITVVGSGSVLGNTTGTATVTYTLTNGCYKTYNVTVKALPTAILGNLNVCGVGAVTFLSDATAGISWTITPAGTATVSASGRVYGVATGTAAVTYNGSNGCITTRIVTVNTLVTTAPILGATNVGHGLAITLSDATPSGVWSSSNSALGSVDLLGNVTGVGTSGTVTISYAVSYAGGGCTALATKPITVHNPAPHTYGGSAITTVGSTVSIADEAMGGNWVSSDNSIATVDGNGMVSAIAAGIANITHSVMGNDGAVSAIVTELKVTALPFEIRLLPNPNSGAFTVVGTTGSNKDVPVYLEITNMLGQVIYTSKATAIAGSLHEQIVLNGSNLADGMYILNIRNGSEHKAFHFVMEKR